MAKDIAPFHAVKISIRAHELIAEGRDVIQMQFGQPSTGAPPNAIARAHAILDSDPMSYWQSPALKARISQLYADRHGVDIAPSRVFLTCGASPALVLALTQAFAPGDRIAFVRPGYVAYRNTVKALHLDPVEIPAGPETRYQLAASHIEALDPAPSGIIVASPANPTGTIIAPDDLKAIADVCAARNIRIISDEIYHGLAYEGRTASMLEYAPDAHVVNSFSKYFSMVGWRLGWLIAPEADAAEVDAHINNMFLTAPSLSQHAGLVAMDEADTLDRHVAAYAENRQLLLDALPAMGLARIAPPDGAFYIYADVSAFTSDSLAFCMQLLEDTGVATAPGIDFDPVDGPHHMRFSFAVSTPQIKDAIERMRPWFDARRHGPV
ncbi:MAG: aminotransferase class I/II-fold pyridoxal phosphate-dependent enzyme [Pseudomonadota bacterium]